MTNQAGQKQCPVCGRYWPIAAIQCICGHPFPPQAYQQPFPPQTMAFSSPPVGPAFDPLVDLARRHRESNKVFIWTLVGGLICIWPLWIISYLEYVKMRDIRNSVAMMGVDVTWWEQAYCAR